MKINLKLFYNYFIINIVYIALAGILFPKKSTLSIIVGGGFALLALFWFVKYVKHPKKFFFVYIYSIYVFILLFNSSDFQYSLKIYLKVFTAIWMFPVAVYIIKNNKAFNFFNNKIYPLIILYLLNFIVMNILGIGLKGYGDTIQTGNLFTEGLNTMAYVIIYLPLLILMNKNKSLNKYIFLILAILVIVELITLKRITIIASIFGIVFYIIFSKDKSIYLRYLVFGMVTMLALFPLYKDVLSKQIINRGTQLELSSYENEMRYMEFFYVNDKIFSFKDLFKSFFGEETFNSQGMYGPLEVFGPDRQIHNDYSRLLFDTGIIGILLYLSLQYSILRMYLTIRQQVKNLFSHKLFSTFNAVFLSIFLVGFIFNFSGGIDGTLFQAFRYVVLGGIIGLFQNRQHYFQNNLEYASKT